MDRTFAVSIHDVAPDTWDACVRLLALLAPLRAPATLLVVPRYHGGTAVNEPRGFGSALRRRVAAGDEIALHGYTHDDDAPGARTAREWARRRLYTASEGEFDAIDETEAARRLTDGCRRLRRLGLPLRAFVAPAWLLGPAAARALARSTLTYTSTRDQLIRIADGATLAAPSLVWSTRAAWRREVSRHWNARRLAALSGAPLVRVALHPSDATYPRVLESCQAMLATLAATRRPVLEFDALAAALELSGLSQWSSGAA